MGCHIDNFNFNNSNSFKGSSISETFDNFDHLNHHWPKIPANLNFNLREICPPKKEFKLAGILGQWWFK